MAQFTSLAATRKYRARFPLEPAAVVRYFARDELPEEVVCEGLGIYLNGTLVIDSLAGSGQDPAAQAIAEKYAISRWKQTEGKLMDMGIEAFVISYETGSALEDLDRAIAAAIELETTTATSGGSRFELRQA